MWLEFDEQHVAWLEAREACLRRALHHRLDPAYGQAAQRRSRRRVDAQELAVQRLVRDGAGEKPGRVTRADLDDARRACPADHGVGGRGVETRKPLLIEPRLRGRPAQTLEPRGMALDIGKHRLERRHAGGEASLQRRIRAGLDRPGVAVGNEETAPAAQQRRQAHGESTRAAAAPFARGPAAGCSTHPAQSSRIRPSLATFEPGQASSSWTAMRSRSASVWSGS